MTYSIGDIIKQYIDLRERKAALAKKHDEEMQAFTGPMQTIENYLMHQMNELGVSQFKEEGVGTAFKSTSTSVQMKEPGEFKEFIFEPALNAMCDFLLASGHLADKHRLSTILRDLPRWDMVDFRAGKKGIQEYQESTEQTVPGVAINTVTTLSIRRA